MVAWPRDKEKQMIVETDGYIELIQYLTGQLPVFTEQGNSAKTADYTLRDLMEERLSESMMAVFEQNELDQEVRLDIVRETDAIVYDLEEVLSKVLDTHPTPQQEAFINEFVGLVKNLFDERLQSYRL
ncbi:MULTISPECIES: DUF3802 family protein [Idiomarina]|jgi:hypothetical protein|nr:MULTISPECIES: DUF3802 family protein [Idiomarina]SFT73546.1 Protein of unknown function [Idiomarina abyssalis]|tara:strand:+ start:87 stop:470 length:384 start_codon:yes stop_codon:yes gene_type:complete